MEAIADHAGESQAACEEAIRAVFPDICPEYLSSVAQENGCSSELAIAHILDRQDDGKPYPKRPKINLKRTREPDDGEIDEAARMSKRFSSEEHRRQCADWSSTYGTVS
jgi:TRIAD3 protein (E3 ubiquitin-protein ligase RNF216)